MTNFSIAMGRTDILVYRVRSGCLSTVWPAQLSSQMVKAYPYSPVHCLLLSPNLFYLPLIKLLPSFWGQGPKIRELFRQRYSFSPVELWDE